MAITRTEIGPSYVAPQPTITAGPSKRILAPTLITPRTAVPRSSLPTGTTTRPPGLIDTAGGTYSPDPTVNPQNGAATSDQSNSGADAQALGGLLSLYQSAFGNGGQGGGAASPGTLIATPATGGTPGDQSTPTASASVNLTTVVLAGIVIGAAYLVYRHYKAKGKTIARAAGAA